MSSPDSGSDSDDVEVYTPLRILAHVKQKKKKFTPVQDPDGSRARRGEAWPVAVYQFLVKWCDQGDKKYSDDSEDTWEPYDCIGTAAEALIDYFIRHPTLLKDPALKARFKPAYKQELKRRKALGLPTHQRIAKSTTNEIDHKYRPSESDSDEPLIFSQARPKNTPLPHAQDKRKRSSTSAAAVPNNPAPQASTSKQIIAALPSFSKQPKASSSHLQPKPKPKPRLSSSTEARASPKSISSKAAQDVLTSKKRRILSSESEDEGEDAPVYPTRKRVKSVTSQPARRSTMPPLQTELSPNKTQKGKGKQRDESSEQQDASYDPLFDDVNFAGGADFGSDLDDLVYDAPPSIRRKASPSLQQSNKSRAVIISDSDDEALFDLGKQPASSKRKRFPNDVSREPSPDASDDFNREFSLSRLSPDPNFYAADPGIQRSLTAESPDLPIRSPEKQSTLFFDSDHSGEGSADHRPRPRKQPKPSTTKNRSPGSVASSGKSQSRYAPSISGQQPRQSKIAASPRRQQRPAKPTSPERSPRRTPIPEPDDSHDALFDGPHRSTVSKPAASNNVLGGSRVTLNWELNQRNVDFDFLEKQVAGFHHISAAVPPDHKKGQKMDVDDHVNAYWGLDAKYRKPKKTSGLTRLQELLAGRTAVIYAPRWSGSTSKVESTTQDVLALQLFLLKRGVDEVCGPSKLSQAIMVFIHISEVRTAEDLEALINYPELNKLRRTNDQVEFAIFGTHFSKQKGVMKPLPVFRRIWHIGAGVTLTAPIIVLHVMTFTDLANASAKWNPVLKLWLHGRSRILSDEAYQNDNSDVLPCISKSCTSVTKPDIAVVHPFFQKGPSSLLHSPTLQPPLWGTDDGFTTGSQIEAQAFPIQPINKLEEVDVLVETSKRLMMTYLETRRWYVVANSFQMLRYPGRQDTTSPIDICTVEHIPKLQELFPNIPDVPSPALKASSAATVQDNVGELPPPVDILSSGTGVAATSDQGAKPSAAASSTWGGGGDVQTSPSWSGPQGVAPGDPWGENQPVSTAATTWGDARRSTMSSSAWEDDPTSSTTGNWDVGHQDLGSGGNWDIDMPNPQPSNEMTTDPPKNGTSSWGEEQQAASGWGDPPAASSNAIWGDPPAASSGATWGEPAVESLSASWGVASKSNAGITAKSPNSAKHRSAASSSWGVNAPQSRTRDVSITSRASNKAAPVFSRGNEPSSATVWGESPSSATTWGDSSTSATTWGDPPAAASAATWGEPSAVSQRQGVDDSSSFRKSTSNAWPSTHAGRTSSDWENKNHQTSSRGDEPRNTSSWGEDPHAHSVWGSPPKTVASWGEVGRLPNRDNSVSSSRRHQPSYGSNTPTMKEQSYGASSIKVSQHGTTSKEASAPFSRTRTQPWHRQDRDGPRTSGPNRDDVHTAYPSSRHPAPVSRNATRGNDSANTSSSGWGEDPALGRAESWLSTLPSTSTWGSWSEERAAVSKKLRLPQEEQNSRSAQARKVSSQLASTQSSGGMHRDRLHQLDAPPADEAASSVDAPNIGVPPSRSGGNISELGKPSRWGQPVRKDSTRPPQKQQHLTPPRVTAPTRSVSSSTSNPTGSRAPESPSWGSLARSSPSVSFGSSTSASTAAFRWGARPSTSGAPHENPSSSSRSSTRQ